ncbi:MAG: hypothetical protein WCS67_01545 [Bacteroidales bacterium]
MTVFDELLYLNMGIALSSFPTSGDASRFVRNGECATFGLEAPYRRDDSQLRISTYSIGSEADLRPKRDFRKLYSDIAESDWFGRSYKGRSLGDFIKVDY